MVDAAPFQALHYDHDVAGGPHATSAPAYDALEPASFAAQVAAGPYTVLQLLTADPAGGFETARATLARWLRTGVLRRDPRPAIYVYEQTELRAGVPAVQRGVLAAVAVADEDMLEHEGVDPALVAARQARLAAVPVDVTPVVAVHVGAAPAVAAVVHEATRTTPLADFGDDAALTHRLWRLTDPADIATVHAAYAGVRVVLADGHHRWAAARALAAADPADPDAARALVWLVDATDGAGPEIRAIHRVVGELGPDRVAMLPAELDLEAVPLHVDGPVGADAAAAALEAALHAAAGPAFGLVTGSAGGARPTLLRPRDPEALRGRLAAGVSDEVRALDVALLDDVVLPSLGVTRFWHTTDAAAAAREVAAGRAGAALLLRPATVAQVLAVAQAGARVPAKSTWFRPKPRAGLVLRPAGRLPV